MRFVAISDTHSRHHSLRLPKGDVLLHAGDVSHRGRKDEILDFLHWFDRQKFAHKIFIGGNHDFFLEKAGEAELKQLIPESITYLQDSSVVIDNIRIWGSPITPWFHNWAFNRHRGPAIRRHWEKIPPDSDIIMTHGPVYGFLDTLPNEDHVGCQDLLRTVLAFRPAVHVCGHIHEAYGSIQRSGIRFVNASQVNDQYELVHPPIVFDLRK